MLINKEKNVTSNRRVDIYLLVLNADIKSSKDIAFHLWDRQINETFRETVAQRLRDKLQVNSASFHVIKYLMLAVMLRWPAIIFRTILAKLIVIIVFKMTIQVVFEMLPSFGKTSTASEG